MYSTMEQSQHCTECPMHHHTNAERSECIPNIRWWISWRDALGVTNTVFCGLGEAAVLVSAIISFIFRKDNAFNDKYTMKCALLFNCGVSYSFVIFHTFSPEVQLCSIRRVAWQTGITAHCVAAMFQIHWGRAQSLRLRAFRVPEALCPYVAYLFFSLLALSIYCFLTIVQNPTIDLTDLCKITGQCDKTYVDCGEENIHGGLVIGFSVVYPAIFGFTAILIAFREVQYHKRTALICSLKTQPNLMVVRTDYRTVRSLLYSAYFCMLVVGALAPIYFTLEDPWNKSFLLLVGCFISNTAILGIYLVPRIRKLIHGRRYTMARHDSRLADVFITTGNLMSKLATSGDQRRKQGKPVVKVV